MADSSTDIFDILHTTRAMRRLKPDPVPDELIRKIPRLGSPRPMGAIVRPALSGAQRSHHQRARPTLLQTGLRRGGRAALS
jgi:hypothetical protein